MRSADIEALSMPQNRAYNFFLAQENTLLLLSNPLKPFDSIILAEKQCQVLSVSSSSAAINHKWTTNGLAGLNSRAPVTLNIGDRQGTSGVMTGSRFDASVSFIVSLIAPFPCSRFSFVSPLSLALGGRLCSVGAYSHGHVLQLSCDFGSGIWRTQRWCSVWF